MVGMLCAPVWLFAPGRAVLVVDELLVMDAVSKASSVKSQFSNQLFFGFGAFTFTAEQNHTTKLLHNPQRLDSDHTFRVT